MYREISIDLIDLTSRLNVSEKGIKASLLFTEFCEGERVGDNAKKFIRRVKESMKSYDISHSKIFPIKGATNGGSARSGPKTVEIDIIIPLDLIHVLITKIFLEPRIIAKEYFIAPTGTQTLY